MKNCLNYGKGQSGTNHDQKNQKRSNEEVKRITPPETTTHKLMIDDAITKRSSSKSRKVC